MENGNKKQSGFSFIELLVVIAVMALIFTLTTANYRDFQSRRSMDNAVTQIKSDLRLAQQYARSGRKPESRCDVLRGYGLRFNNTSFYSMVADCVVSNNPTIVQISEKEISNMNINVHITGSYPPHNLSFNVLGRGTNLGNGNTATITITRDSDTRQIVVDSGGNIE